MIKKIKENDNKYRKVSPYKILGNDNKRNGKTNSWNKTQVAFLDPCKYELGCIKTYWLSLTVI